MFANAMPVFCKVRHGTVRHGTVRHGTVRHGTVRHGTVRHGKVRHGTVAWQWLFASMSPVCKHTPQRTMVCCADVIATELKPADAAIVLQSLDQLHCTHLPPTP